MGVLGRLISPGAAIGVALLVLARAERNRALLLLTLGYLAVVLVPVRFGWVLDSPWYILPPLVIDGSVLARLRVERGLYQHELARAIGISVDSLRRFESGNVVTAPLCGCR